MAFWKRHRRLPPSPRQVLDRNVRVHPVEGEERELDGITLPPGMDAYAAWRASRRCGRLILEGMHPDEAAQEALKAFGGAKKPGN